MSRRRRESAGGPTVRFADASERPRRHAGRSDRPEPGARTRPRPACWYRPSSCDRGAGRRGRGDAALSPDAIVVADGVGSTAPRSRISAHSARPACSSSRRRCGSGCPTRFDAEGRAVLADVWCAGGCGCVGMLRAPSPGRRGSRRCSPCTEGTSRDRHDPPVVPTKPRGSHAGERRWLPTLDRPRGHRGRHGRRLRGGGRAGGSRPARPSGSRASSRCSRSRDGSAAGSGDGGRASARRSSPEATAPWWSSTGGRRRDAERLAASTSTRCSVRSCPSSRCPTSSNRSRWRTAPPASGSASWASIRHAAVRSRARSPRWSHRPGGAWSSIGLGAGGPARVRRRRHPHDDRSGDGGVTRP